MPDKRPGGPLPGQTGTQQKNPAPGKGTAPAKPSPDGKGGGGKK